MAKWKNCKMAKGAGKRQNDKMVKWPNDKEAKWETANGKMVQW